MTLLRMAGHRCVWIGALSTLVAGLAWAGASDSPNSPIAVPADPDALLTGDEIYQRVLDNRFEAYEQTLQMESGDRSGKSQATRLHMKYMSFKKKSSKILSKTIAKYFEPTDVRHLGYLVVNKKEGADDQFVYRPSSRRVRRVNLRGEAVFGTDFSFEDIIPQEFEDATYERLPDEKVSEVDCFSVEVTPTQDAESEYSRFVVRVDKTHYVPLQTRYWDDRDVQTKLLTADPESIVRYDVDGKAGAKEVWIAMRSKIVNLKYESYTALDIEEFHANPKLKPKDFTERKLTSSR